MFSQEKQLNYFEYPLHVDLNLTSRCDLCCVHCHDGRGQFQSENKELSFEQVVGVIDELHRWKNVSLLFSGGEPFLREDIFEILRYACGYDWKQVGVVSNGISVNDRILKGALPNLVLNISLDGASSCQNSILRKSPVFSAEELFSTVVNNIKVAVSNELNVSVNFSITALTMDNLVSAYDYAVNEIGVKTFVGIKFFESGRGADCKALNIDYSNWSVFFAELTKEKIKGNFSKMQISVPSAWEFYLPLIENDVDIKVAERAWRYVTPLRQVSYSKKCKYGDPSGISTLCIDYDGSVYPSVLLAGHSEWSCGNVSNQSLENIWQNSKVLSKIRNRVFLPNDGCNSCCIRDICGGGSFVRGVVNTREGCFCGDSCCPLRLGK